jgi:2-methylcitrate dehydratase PrpD
MSHSSEVAAERGAAIAFAEYACAARENALEPEVRHAATRAVVDWFGATIAGSVMEPAQILARALLPESVGTSRLVGDGRLTSSRTAALVNGTASHTAELDDIYREGMYHPGSPTIAAALALGEREQVSGPELLHAVTTGYEVGNRIAAAIQPAHYVYWHTTGTVGTLGAAVAGAEILRLDRDRLAHALATATTMAAALQQAFRSDSMSKPLHAGHAAEAGVLAALAARDGFTGAAAILEGEAGFGVAMSDGPDWGAAIDNLGRQPTIMSMTMKPHACCGHAFAAVDAALELRARGVRPEEVSTILVETYAVATSVAGNPDPQTAAEAKFSIAYCVAAALATGSVQIATFDEETLGRADLRDLLKRVVVLADPEHTAAFPHQRAARLRLEQHSGAVQVVERNTRKGDPDDPLTDDDARAKFTALATPVLGEARSADLLRSLWRLPEIADLSTLPLGPA